MYAYIHEKLPHNTQKNINKYQLNWCQIFNTGGIVSAHMNTPKIVHIWIKREREREEEDRTRKHTSGYWLLLMFGTIAAAWCRCKILGAHPIRNDERSEKFTNTHRT